MSRPDPVCAVNDIPFKSVEVECDCGYFWSLAQQFSYVRLSDRVGDNSYELVDLYAARARRIAATYARFYLETEEGGDPAKLGRYYWMALGAFASKTIACLLDTFQIQGSYIAIKTIANSLAQGNLWLFCDISAVHWMYNNHPQHFQDGMNCLRERDVRKLWDPVKANLFSLPWADESLDKVEYLKMSESMRQGFVEVRNIENAQRGSHRWLQCQFDHLVHIADHEQKEILQKMIYSNPDFRKWLERERNWALLRWLSPAYRLVFSHMCSPSDLTPVSNAPDDMEVENFASRMSWIQDAAERFHALMQERRSYMMRELAQISTWVDSPDASFVY